MLHHAWIIPLIPAASFFLILSFGKRLPYTGAEIGTEGVARQEQLLTLVRAHGARLVGPNCLGIATAAVGLNATFAPRAFPAGRIGFSSQSGALGLALLERAEARGLGLSAFVSIGNKADVSSNDLLEWWEDDPGTDLVLLYVESFGNPRKFARVARDVSRKKPIVAVRGGRRLGAATTENQRASTSGSRPIWSGPSGVISCGGCAPPRLQEPRAPFTGDIHGSVTPVRSGAARPPRGSQGE